MTERSRGQGMDSRLRGNDEGEHRRPGVWNSFTPMARFDREPQLVVERAEGNRLIDTEGREYIDGVASLWAIVHGHGHPHIVEAITRQAERLQHSTLLGIGHAPALELTERLAGHVPEGLAHFFYSSDGASAVEAALKMALQYWVNVGRPERNRLVSMEMAYHGDTLGAASLGGEGPFRKPYEAAMFEPLRFANPYALRCGRCAPPEGCTLACAESLESLLDERGEEIAAVVVEPRVQGAGGIIVAPEGHLRYVADLCRRHGVLLIADEVATGFGKTGAMFACDLEGVTPDIMALGKGLSGGYLPLSATAATDRVYDAFYDDEDYGKTLYHGHTYGGNPIACAAALASLDIFESEPVLERVGRRSAALSEMLHEMIAGHPLVAEVRQQGLMTGIEVSSAPAAWSACLGARDRGVFVRPLGETIVVMPPLSIEERELEQICEAVRYGLDDAPRSAPSVG